MQRNGLSPIQSSFLSCPQDVKLILNKLFVESGQYGDWLKKLLIINQPNCLQSNLIEYNDIVRQYSVKDLFDKSYIRLTPRLEFGEHESVQSYIMLTFDNFTSNRTDPKYRDCMINFDILCNTKQWQLDDFRIRPLMIAGYIDGILNLKKLSGIGELVFLGCNELLLDPNLAGYTLSYQAVHFTEDDKKIKDLSSK